MNLLKKLKIYLNVLIILLLAKSFLSCHYIGGQSIGFQVNAPALNGSMNSSSYTSFAAIQIPVQITNSSGFNLQTSLNAGSNSLQLPTGTIHIKIGYLAQGLKSSQTNTCNNTNSGNEDDDVLYSEFESDYTINANTESININFPKPFEDIPFDHFGFTITDSSGNPAAGAQIYYVDTISGVKLKDRCKGTDFNDTADSLGRFAIDLPIYSSKKQFKFIVVSADGNTRSFQSTLKRGSSKAQFYFMKMADGSMTAMNELTDSFLGDGFTIAQRRDSLLKNPRFPDISSVTLNAPNYMTGFVSLYPFNSQSTNDLIYKRKFNIFCEIKDSSSNVIYPMQDCKYNYSNIFKLPDPEIAINTGGYTLSVYYVDTEGYCPITSPYGCSAAGPVSVLFNYGSLPKDTL